jgi:hypothetical protein
MAGGAVEAEDRACRTCRSLSLAAERGYHKQCYEYKEVMLFKQLSATVCRLYRFTNNTANHGTRDLERLASRRSLAH